MAEHIEPRITRGQMLRDFGRDWILDGDLLWCRDCRRAQEVSWQDSDFEHRSDCSKRRIGGRPWTALQAILVQLPAAVTGAMDVAQQMQAEVGRLRAERAEAIERAEKYRGILTRRVERETDLDSATLQEMSGALTAWGAETARKAEPGSAVARIIAAGEAVFARLSRNFEIVKRANERVVAERDEARAKLAALQRVAARMASESGHRNLYPDRTRDPAVAIAFDRRDWAEFVAIAAAEKPAGGGS